MLLFLKKKTDDGDKLADAQAIEARDLHEFVPYHSHYNMHTLLTRNGELMQIIKIDGNNQGLNYESINSEERTVREHIRSAIAECIPSDQYALWVHTIRKRKNIHYSGKFDDPFASHMNEQWQKNHHWKYQYYNEIYVTVLHEGQACKLFDKHTLSSVLLPRHNRKYRNAYLDQAAEELEAVVSNILERIRADYRTERLSIIERSGNTVSSSIFYSQPLEFLGTLLNLKTEPFPVRELDLGKELCDHTLTFGFNALESKDAKGHRRFAALVSLKQYREVTPDVADRLMQMPLEFILSQAFIFAPSSKALRQYRIQKELFEISGDTYSIAASGLQEMLGGDHGNITDFGEVQTTVMVLSDDYKQLDDDVEKVHESFADMGLLTVREDIKLEECFWAQLPGNFEFIRRRNLISTPRVAGFCRLNLFAGGIDHGNHWGEAVALMPTLVRSPYFFNFHVKDNGHTAMFNFNSFNDSAGHVLLNFLLTSTFKYQGRMFIFDRNRSARLWFDKIKGEYHLLPITARKPVHDNLKLNPFTLDDNKRNRSFLLAWCTTLIEPYFAIEDEHKDILVTAIDQLYNEAPEQRHLQTLVDIIAAHDYRLAASFAAYHNKGAYAGLFDSVQETLNMQHPWHAFDMDPVIKHSACLIPVFSYLLHRIIAGLDGKPTIIVLHEAWDLLENAFFTPRLESLLEMLKQNNVMMICTTQHTEACVNKQSFATFMQGAATQLYIPDDIVIDYASTLPFLSTRDVKLLLHMDRQKGDFLLRQNNESIALRANLNDLDDVRSIFANDVKTLMAAGGKFATLPNTYDYAEDVT